MPCADFEIVGIVSRGDLDCSGSELWVWIQVSDERNLSVDEGHSEGLTNFAFVPLVGRVNRDGDVAEKGLRPGGCNDYFAAAVSEFVADVIEIAFPGLAEGLDVGNTRLEFRIPVDNSLAPVDESLVVPIDEDFEDGIGILFIERELGT